MRIEVKGCMSLGGQCPFLQNESIYWECFVDENETRFYCDDIERGGIQGFCKLKDGPVEVVLVGEGGEDDR